MQLVFISVVTVRKSLIIRLDVEKIHPVWLLLFKWHDYVSCLAVCTEQLVKAMQDTLFQDSLHVLTSFLWEKHVIQYLMKQNCQIVLIPLTAL